MKDLSGVLKDTTTGPSAVNLALQQAESRLDGAVRLTSGTQAWFERLNEISRGKLFNKTVARLQRVHDRFRQQASTVRDIQAAISRGEAVSDTLLNRLNTLSDEAAADLGDLIGRFDTEITPNIASTVKQARQSTDQIHTILKQASARVPDMEKLLSDANKGLALGDQGIKVVTADLPIVKSKIGEITSKIRDFEKHGNIEEIIDLLQNNFEKESAFFAQPVILKENKLFPIPNYGSGMSPFFTTLSLWVGALLLVSLLTVEVHHEGVEYRGYQIYFGRYLTFVTIAILQSLFDTLGDIYLLGVFVREKLWFVLFGVFLSIVFMLIVYTLVSIFGNVGKALSIVLLVLQLAGAGGTFPIQVTPHFFQVIHPFLPFTYAISMMREATGGILWDIVQKDFWMLLMFAGIALLLGLVLKTPINKVSQGMVQKAKKSKLIH